MDNKSYKHLKSGTDIRGVAIQTATNEITLTIDSIHDLTHAFLKWLSDKTGKNVLTVAVGHDVRLSCNAIYDAIKKVFAESGCNLIYYGLMSTPAMFMLLKESEIDCDASIMITASHLPFDKNGLKFMTPAGGLSGSDLDKVIALAEAGET
ncbi:MAG: phosphomannomutase/phosphoglucomutase, partial [Clostridia bacterium]|nr:phosphomannomutase/phosphoglucomutase [Clostridia bacterium]